MDMRHPRSVLLSPSSKTGPCFLVVATLLTQSSVAAAPCAGTIAPTAAPLEQSGVGDGGSGVNVVVSPESGQDLATLFDCEGGDFDVYWRGVVSVPGTIVIGRRTTVRIVGDTSNSSTSTSTSSGSGSDINQQQGLQELSTTLPPLPNGLASAAVRTTQPSTTSTSSSQYSSSSSTNRTGVGNIDDSLVEEAAPTGPVFFVDGGQLFLQGLAVQGGQANSSPDSSGGGVHAVDANVTVTGCEFEDNFAARLGGGIFTKRSTLVVIGSVFRRCQADVVSPPGVDADGAGGGIGVENTNVLIDGCLFDSCYASKKGGGFHQDDGNVSVVNSLFYNNTAGSSNEEDEDPVGEGGAVSFTDCHASFDGLAAGGANDTVFVSNNVAKKGGAVVIWSKSAPSQVEFHRCTMENGTAGVVYEDDPQGEGGALALGGGTTAIVVDCLLVNNFAGDKSGAIATDKGDDFDDGPVAILRNSMFSYNQAGVGNGGVALLEGWASLTVDGDGNTFAYNKVTASGAVFSNRDDSTITIKGGEFLNNTAEKAGAVYTTGKLTILGGTFRGNMADAEGEATGGAIFAATGSIVTIAADAAGGGGGALFEGNQAKDGGAIYVYSGAQVRVEGGVFSRNVAANSGGGIAVVEDATLEITGGNFSANEADFGGFLYNRGGGVVSCTGGSVARNQAVDGGGVYVVEKATIDWACGLDGNIALSGPAIYARDGSTAVIHGVTLQDNVANTGPVVLIVSSSNLRTYQVVFNDTSGSDDASAVQLDRQSSYKAEDTSFVGFDGEPIVYSEGTLHLDDCDFTESSASVLVFSDGVTPVIRNTALGDRNYYFDGSNMPKADSLINVHSTTCDGGAGEDIPFSGPASDNDPYASSWSSSTSSSPCSEGSTCLEGVFGVYCLCYVRESALGKGDAVPRETCINGDPGSLRLAADTEPPTAFYPELLKGKLRLFLDAATPMAATAVASTSTSDSGLDAARSGFGVAWSISTSSSVFSEEGEEEEEVKLGTGMMDWEVYPSTGLLLPGQSVTLTVATLPSENFDGLATASFTASSMVASQDETPHVTINNATQQGNVLFDVAFYHCKAGGVWVLEELAGEEVSASVTSSLSATASNSSDTTFSCELCADTVEEGLEGVNCSEPGVTTRTLPVNEGFWRASLDSIVIRQCLNEDACQGGSSIANVAEYCNEGYQGPQCAVCAPGYGSGVANTCHLCSARFKTGMFVLSAVILLLVLVVAAVLAVYLVGGRDAVSTTISRTRKSFSMDSGLSLFRGRSNSTWLNESTANARRSFRGGGSDDSALSTFCGLGVIGSSIKSAEVVPSSYSAKAETSGSRDGDVGVMGGGAGDGAVATDDRAGDDESGNAAALVEAPPLPPAGVPACAATGVATAVAAISGPFAAEDTGHGSSKRVDGKEQKRTAAARISKFISAIPLSKLKIVIVVWQILVSFSEITQVPFPPVYEKFLTIIGIFSFDLGWMLSAACMATEIGFFDKLLMVTIGPMVLLCLLGVTFYIGSKKVFAGSGKGTPSLTGSGDDNHDASDRDCTTDNSATAATNRRRGLLVTADTTAITPATTTAAVMAQRPVYPATLGRNKSSTQRIFEAGAGEEADVKQTLLWQLFARHTTMTLIILYLVYTQVSTVVFQAFACEDFPEIGKRYLRADFRLECDTTKHETYKIYAAIMVCVYPFGIPAAFCYFLVRQGSRINPRINLPVRKGSDGISKRDRRVVAEKMRRRGTDRAIAPTSFLWTAFLPHRYYYEVVECFRRLLLTGLLVFAMPDTPGQVAFGCIFAFISLMVFELLRPHSDNLEGQLYRTGCLLIFFTNFLALAIKAEVASPDSNGSAMCSMVLVVANGLFFLTVFSNTWFTAKATYTNSYVTDFLRGVAAKGGDDEIQKAKNGRDVEEMKVNEDQELPTVWDGGK